MEVVKSRFLRLFRFEFSVFCWGRCFVYIFICGERLWVLIWIRENFIWKVLFKEGRDVENKNKIKINLENLESW